MIERGIRLCKVSSIGKNSEIIASTNIVKAKAEKTHVEMFAIHKKKPIRKANPPIPSFPKLYAPPDIGRLVSNSE